MEPIKPQVHVKIKVLLKNVHFVSGLLLGLNVPISYVYQRNPEIYTIIQAMKLKKPFNYQSNSEKELHGGSWIIVVMDVNITKDKNRGFA